MKYCYMLLLVIVIILTTMIFHTTSKNSFQNNNIQYKWSSDLIKRFNIYQTTMNKNKTQFDLDILQQQASPYEVEHLIKTGYWPWNDKLKYEYLNAVSSSPIIRIDPNYALDYAMKIYNQNAVRELLAWNTKEGQFLLYGGDLGVSNGMPSNVHNTIKCSTDTNGNSIMEKTIYTGINLWNGYMNSVTTTVNPENIHKDMPGFTFVNKTCNPCVALNSPGDFSCPFKLNVRGNNTTSYVWRSLWGI